MTNNPGRHTGRMLDDSDMFGPVVRQTERSREALLDNPAYISKDVGGRKVYIKQEALNRMMELGKEHGSQPNTSVEVSFLCLGRKAHDNEGEYTIIESLPFIAKGEKSTVRLPIEAKERARKEAAVLDVVGWAHTHPGFGVFFSEPDLSTCADFGEDAVNLVYDPIREELGIALSTKMLLTERTLRAMPRAGVMPSRELGKAVAQPTLPRAVVVATSIEVPSALAPDVTHEPAMPISRPIQAPNEQTRRNSLLPVFATVGIFGCVCLLGLLVWETGKMRTDFHAHTRVLRETSALIERVSSAHDHAMDRAEEPSVAATPRELPTAAATATPSVQSIPVTQAASVTPAAPAPKPKLVPHKVKAQVKEQAQAPAAANASRLTGTATMPSAPAATKKEEPAPTTPSAPPATKEEPASLSGPASVFPTLSTFEASSKEVVQPVPNQQQ